MMAKTTTEAPASEGLGGPGLTDLATDPAAAPSTDPAPVDEPTPLETAVAAADAAPADPAADPAVASAEAEAEAKGAADEAAKAKGFANAQAEADAKAAAETGDKKAAKPRQRKPKAPVAADLPELADWLASGHGELSIGFGDVAAPAASMPSTPVAGMTRRGGRFVTDGAVVPRTARLPGALSVTHAWLIDGTTPIARCELGAAMTLQPNVQVEFKAGSLAFS
ncbi:hypothetical protein GV829_04610 [Sphingomonas lacunae]|uniref:Uncharacterized protein n=1 Tax=Sphingomonas lacunae TaxID=2698828 RepID=A0A6M4ARY9_9SPHN|nr:hypothetical protein [Sphingomonas lacunae]QJQ31817.1 hypothetical protein GV829_04610 [Sphingomonas lacunae]